MQDNKRLQLQAFFVLGTLYFKSNSSAKKIAISFSNTNKTNVSFDLIPQFV